VIGFHPSAIEGHVQHPKNGSTGQLPLAGRRALITGGGTGLGLAIGRALARSGAAIAIASRSAEHLEAGRRALADEGATVEALECDVRDHHAARRTVRSVVERLGGLEILINNAAGNFVRPAERLPEKAFANVVDIVLNGTFNCSRAAGRAMIEAGTGGVILNIVATYAWTGGPGTIHSACSKAGVLALTRTLAVEWARHGIRVVALAPGPFDSSGAADRLWPSAELEDKVRRSIPLARFATREEVADAAAWLCSERAGYVTGECLTMDGGGWLGRGILGADEPVPTVRRRRPPREGSP
jgi:NAD(P)-dependent dehydrogenase (short-subunit alcohol dehydrogenase family)